MAKRRKKIDADGFIILLFSAFISMMLAAMRYAFYMFVQILQLVSWGLLFAGKALFRWKKRYSQSPKHQLTTIAIKDNIQDADVDSNHEDTIYQQLKGLYNDYYPKLISSLDSISAFERSVSYPLLIFPFPEYINSSTKVMFIGKETHYWILNKQNGFIKKDNSTENVVSKLMENYRVFRYGENYVKSPFWQFCHAVNENINNNASQTSFIWNNAIKVDEKGKTPGWDVMKASSTFYPILREELAILKPDVVIFLTGDKLDKYLTHLFEGVIISEIAKDLRRASHPLLPSRTYITHHPKRLRLKGIFNETINAIIKNADGVVVRTPDVQL